jgi:hypothetical protein
VIVIPKGDKTAEESAQLLKTWFKDKAKTELNIITDDVVATDNEISFGSTNITKKAFNQLSELNLFVNNIDCPFCTRVWTSIEHDIDESKRIASYKDVRYNKAFALVEGFLV